MQDASAEFAAAITKGEVDWVGPTLLVDWLSDGATELDAGQPAYTIERFLNRDASAGWGRPRDDGRGPQYLHVGGTSADYTIEPGAGYGRHRYSAVNTNRASLIQTASRSMTLLVGFKTSAELTGTGESVVNAIVRSDGTGDNHYMASMDIDQADDTIDIKLTARSGGSDTDLTSLDDQLTYVHGHEYVMRVEFNETNQTIKAKYWDATIEIEPADWMLEHEITALVAIAGTYGGVRTAVPSGTTTSTPFYYHITQFRLIDGSIDDLSDLAGQIVVTHNLDDGLPDQVSFVSDLGTEPMDAVILGGRRGLNAAQYLSSYNPSSPLYNLARDVAPVTLEHGVVTSAGPEMVRLFTGQLIDVALGRDKLGHLTAMSSTRLKLSTLLRPPAVQRLGDLNATWLVSWAAYFSGVYAAPPAADRDVMYAPLHGSLMPFRDGFQPTATAYPSPFWPFWAGYYRDVGDADYELLVNGVGTAETGAAGGGDDPESVVPEYVDGPYVAAPSLRFNNDVAVGIFYSPLSFDANVNGDFELLSQAGPRGRFEFTVRGDDFDSVGPSGADLAPTTYIVGLFIENDSGSYVRVGINMSRQVQVEMFDGTATLNQTFIGMNLPTDGQWHKYGIAWDFAAEAAYGYYQEPNGDETIGTLNEATLDVTRLPANDETFATVDPFDSWPPGLNPNMVSPYFHAFLPVSELHLSAGTGANPANEPWIWEADHGFEASAIIGRAKTQLRALVEVSEREAWEIIGEVAQAEMAATGIDEHDRLLFLPPNYWAREEQQTVTQILSTETNVGELVPQVDPSKIRNSVRVQYQDVRVDHRFYAPVFMSRDVVALPPGESNIVIPLEIRVTALYGSVAELISSANVAAGLPTILAGLGTWKTFFTVNSKSDGTGTYYTNSGSPFDDPIYMQVRDAEHPGLAIVQVFNNTTDTLYFANNNPEVPTIAIAGAGTYFTDASVTSSRPASIARRGERGLAADTPFHQRRDSAQRLATRLMNELAEPSPTLEQVRLFGDQRRQPGDLVTFDDRESGISGSWRLLGVKHVINGANYYQEARLRQALSVGVWGTGRWGQCLWGDQQ